MRNEWNTYLYEYYKEHGKIFWGDSNAKLPVCSSLIEWNGTSILLSPVSISESRRYHIMFSQAQIQLSFKEPFKLRIVKDTLMQKGSNLILKNDIMIGNDAIDKKFHISSSDSNLARTIIMNKEFTNMLLGENEQALYEIYVEPCEMDEAKIENTEELEHSYYEEEDIKESEKELISSDKKIMHTLRVVCKINIVYVYDGIGLIFAKENLEEMIKICKTSYEVLKINGFC